ncbi:putative amidoligase enzyme-domain-containing protein [Xylariaceae sp. FL0016]|nr:putative amidoligase enzyme-domain-containing protein [Xylariaceae sp. FL0016]
MSEPPKPPKYSLGVEIEAYAAIVVEGHQSPDIPIFRNHPAQPMVVTEQERWGYELAERLKQEVRDCINTVLAKQGHGWRVQAPPPRDSPDANQHPLRQHPVRFEHWSSSHWVVKDDLTLVPLQDLDVDTHYFEFVSFEVVSPPLWACDQSYDEIWKVCDAIRSTFWVLTPRQCGLHVHVGMGLDTYPLDQFQRIAAFLYAADSTLVQMHPSHRRNNCYARSNRHFSFLTLGMTAADATKHMDETSRRIALAAASNETLGMSADDAARYLEDVMRRIEVPPLGDRPLDWGQSLSSGTLPPSPADFSNTPTITSHIDRTIPSNAAVFGERGRLGGYSHAQDPQRQWLRYDFIKENRTSLPDIKPSLEEIFKARRLDVVADLMQIISRGAYHFLNVTDDQKRTIEFRQPAGAIHPCEVAAMARICVGLCEWASEASSQHWWSVVQDLIQGEDDMSWYDVFDLLAEIDLLPEAKVLAAITTPGRGLHEVVVREYMYDRNVNGFADQTTKAELPG